MKKKEGTSFTRQKYDDYLWKSNSENLNYDAFSALVLFAFLESALGFCAGCHVYTLTRKFLPTPDIE